MISPIPLTTSYVLTVYISRRYWRFDSVSSVPSPLEFFTGGRGRLGGNNLPHTDVGLPTGSSNVSTPSNPDDSSFDGLPHGHSKGSYTRTETAPSARTSRSF